MNKMTKTEAKSNSRSGDIDSDDYYAILGVSKGATAKEIKDAYKKLASKYHPDKQAGSEEKFKKLKEAFDVLSNPLLRKEYDKYGKSTLNNANKIHEAATNMIVNIFLNLIERVQENYQTEDLVLIIDNIIDKEIIERNKNIKVGEKRIKKLVKIQKRILLKNNKDKKNLLQLVLDSEMERTKEKIQNEEETLKISKTAKEILKEYEYIYDTIESRQMTTASPFNIITTATP